LTAIITFSEDPALAGEVAAAGAELAKMLGEDGSVVLRAEGSPGADPDATAAGLVEAAKAHGLGALLVGESRFGTIVAAKVAARLRVGSLGKGKSLRVEGGRLIATRDVYGGRFQASVAVNMPCVAVVQQGSYRAAEAATGRSEALSVAGGEARVTTIETRPSQRAIVDVKSADVIVSAGRGFTTKGDLALAQGLADSLGGVLGGSRPLTSELGWLGEDQQIGLTGAYVHPKLYVAVGISGQMQHVAGIKDSKLIVAINNDAQAPIFQFADYGIVGDLYEVLPALTKLLKVGQHPEA